VTSASIRFRAFSVLRGSTALHL